MQNPLKKHLETNNLTQTAAACHTSENTIRAISQKDPQQLRKITVGMYEQIMEGIGIDLLSYK